MTERIRLVVLVFALLASARAFSGGMDSGGGRGLVCFQTKEVADKVRDNLGYINDSQLTEITFIEPIDLYYAKQRRGIDHRAPKLATPYQSESFLQYLERLVQRIEVSIPPLGEKIRSTQKEFSGDNTIWHDLGLIPIFDEKSVAHYNTKLCTVTTMAIQFKEEGRNFLNIDHRLFFHPKHSVMGKAVLFMHEYFYLLARKLGGADSRSTRIVLGHLLKNETGVKVEDLAKILLDFRFLGEQDIVGGGNTMYEYYPTFD
ncbi:MAG: hypothetical protein HOE90_22050 [Bacteriovoracaceae bacterium]|nr:hypothetical protein [Bacteriovoracaceae bacterium]